MTLTETFSFLPKEGHFCRNNDGSAEIGVFLHFCRNSFLNRKLILPGRPEEYSAELFAESLFGPTLLFMSSTKAATLGKNSLQRNFLKIVELIHKTGVDIFLKTYLTSLTRAYFMNQPSATRGSRVPGQFSP